MNDLTEIQSNCFFMYFIVFVFLQGFTKFGDHLDMTTCKPFNYYGRILIAYAIFFVWSMFAMIFVILHKLWQCEIFGVVQGFTKHGKPPVLSFCYIFQQI